ncbi:MAG: sulfite exporter TauE/SafE family protein [Bacteroidales bacterium]|nr:sulfite exporter TauE/SafE family protein [Bacteroidales bacterium]MCB9013196.1 sulfite exporter TauE/SafE family protein [Bacteroidales bacterium]
MSITQLIIIILVGILGGFASGIFGIGGGIIIVPALVFLVGMTQQEAQGTSLTMMLAPIGILGVINYYKAGYVNMKYAVILMIAFLLGSYFGSKLAIHIEGKALRQAFGVLTVLMGMKLIFGK